jgi:hypothetical protein
MPGLVYSLHQAGGFHGQSTSQLHDIEQANVALTAFDATHVVAVQISQLRQFFLREFALEPQLANAITECSAGVKGRHGAMIGA